MTLNEVSPPGWGHTKAEKEKTKPNKPKSKIGGSAAAFKRALDDGRFKGLPGSKTKKEKTADMFKLMWSMKKKGDKPHYKPGTDKKYKKYQEEETSMRKKRDVTKSKPKAPQFDAAKELVTNAPYMKPALQQREGTSYKTFMADVQSAKDRLKKKVEDRKKKDAQFVDTKTKGVRFFDKKGKGRIVKGRKIYD